jgi:hypothetical protein
VVSLPAVSGGSAPSAPVVSLPAVSGGSAPAAPVVSLPAVSGGGAVSAPSAILPEVVVTVEGEPTFLETAFAGANNDLRFTLGEGVGVASIRFFMGNLGATEVTVLGTAISIRLSMNFSANYSTAANIKTLVEASTAASALVTVAFAAGNSGAGNICQPADTDVSFGPITLGGGSAPTAPVVSLPTVSGGSAPSAPVVSLPAVSGGSAPAAPVVLLPNTRAVPAYIYVTGVLSNGGVPVVFPPIPFWGFNPEDPTKPEYYYEEVGVIEVALSYLHQYQQYQLSHYTTDSYWRGGGNFLNIPGYYEWVQDGEESGVPKVLGGPAPPASILA